LFGSVLFCLVLWLLSVRVVDGLWLHLLGVTSLTLVLGWCFAVLAASMAVTLHTLMVGEPVGAIPLAWLLTAALPATVSIGLARALRAVQSRNLFVYMLGAGFGGGILAALSVTLAAVVVFWLMGAQDWLDAAGANWPVLLLFLFPEGFINGMLVTTVTVFFPGLVKTFDEAFYLDGP
jgi:uncharacterized membrane protein